MTKIKKSDLVVFIAVCFILAICVCLSFAGTHSPWDGTGWDVTSPDIDQPHGNAYKEIYDLRKGTAIRMNKEHVTLAASSAGGEHIPGGCNILFYDDTTAVDANVSASALEQYGLIYDTTLLQFFTMNEAEDTKVAITIGTAGIADANVATADIADSAVTTAKIADANVATADIADSAATTAKIADANVTLAKMADDSIDSDQYVDGSIDSAHFSTGCVLTDDIANANVTAAKMADAACFIPLSSPEKVVDTTSASASSWVELNLSSHVGSKRALCYFRIVNNSGATRHFCIRTEGDDLNVGRDTTSRLGGGTSGCSLTDGYQAYLMCMTDNTGKVDYYCDGDSKDVDLYLVGYLK